MPEETVIEAELLTKRYAARPAVDRLSFSIKRGEVVGLLGPNGAGKTTTMRILSCFLPATSGTARVAGFDVFTQTDEVRRRIGYMPEHNPLHLDMRVRDYLKFRARIKGLAWKESRRRVDEVTERCGLGEVARRVIGQLSKGYRQRVGLADALVHEPEVLILDEPTIGLDPIQIRSVRQLIKGLAERHTVLISSHILPEVEMTCGRVLILGNGRILAADTPENLQRSFHQDGQAIAEIAAPQAELEAWFEEMPEVDGWSVDPADGDYCRCWLSSRSGADLRATVFERVQQRGWKLRELTRQRFSLEDVFVRLTRTDREDEA